MLSHAMGPIPTTTGSAGAGDEVGPRGRQVVVGDPSFDILDLPGHTPGGIGLFEFPAGRSSAATCCTTAR